MNKNILLISNDKLFFKKDIISSDYNDTINIIEALSKKSFLSFCSRSASERQNFISKNNKYNKFSKLNFLNLKKYKNYKIFMISITPFNLFILLILKILNKKISGYAYLRSDGYKEYYYKYGIFGRFLFNIMFKIVIKFLKIISVSNNLTGLKKNYDLVNPSEISNEWLKNIKKPNLKIPKLLYLGRYKKEKGVHSLVNIINQIEIDLKLNIIGLKKKIHYKNKKINFFVEFKSFKKVINAYDKCNIFILPSYTEGSPKVILESLARQRPVIVFEDIKHVKKNFKGIFICKRNDQDLLIAINYIMKNYKKIIKKIKLNKIVTKKQFQNELNSIVL